MSGGYLEPCRTGDHGHFRPVGATAQFPSERPFIKSINGQPYSGAKREPLREAAQI
jgi:hypothetical protein